MTGRTHLALASELDGKAASAGPLLRAGSYYYVTARAGPF
jgi:hypothetical protein